MIRPRSLILLAGGQSLRMGRDKAWLPAGKGTILSQLVGRLSPVVDETVVAGYHRRDAMLPVRWVPDAVTQAGPLAGILAGLKAIQGPYGWVVGCDLPDVEPELGELLYQEALDYEAVIPRPGREPEGVCGLYSASLVDAIEELLRSGQRSVISLLQRSRVRYLSAEELVQADPDLRSFRNLNTPEDYLEWLRSQAS